MLNKKSILGKQRTPELSMNKHATKINKLYCILAKEPKSKWYDGMSKN